MCKVSDKLKLCTCKTENVERLKHYWILYKYQKREIIMIGEPMLPQVEIIGEETDQANYKKLEGLLNDGNCFDVELPISNKDILELNFSFHPKSDIKETIYLVYEFVYKKNKWVISEYNPFDSNKIEKQHGKILNAFTKNK